MAEKSLNQVELIGRLGRDAETKFIGDGTAVTKFSIATTRAWKKGEELVEETDWANCVLWRAEKLATFLTKGSRVYVQGRMQTRKYDKDGVTHYSTEVVVNDVILLGAKGESSSTPAPVSAPVAPKAAEVDDSELPF